MKQKQKNPNNKKASTEKGSTMVEYALLVSLISIGSIITITAIQVSMEDKFREAAESLGAGNQNPMDLP